MAFQITRYNKATALAIGAAATQLVAALTSLDQESVQIIGNALTLVLVWLVPNAPAADTTKPATP